ncbi:MAG: NAD(P)-dependent oxidoreductase [Betaproteobacteria bacterium]|nr:NAD(P)-dependent oxidoreductase [Betaproteobacteria bacterium]
MKRILITGAAGAIGQTLRAGLTGLYRPLRLADIKPIQGITADEEGVMGDLTDFSAVGSMMQGIDCVVHLGGVPREGPWEAILNSNIVGTYNVFEAARQAGVRRVIFASSNHVIGYYRVTQTVGIEEPPRPDSRYGLSKVFGEALGRLYADKHGLSVACLRIGSFRPHPENARQLSTWVSPRDLTQLVRRCIDATHYRYLALYGVSGNTRSRWGNPHAAVIGYAPQDNAETYAAHLAVPPDNGADPATAFHGGEFCALEFTGDIESLE